MIGLGEGTQKVGPSPSRAKAAAIRRNPRLTHNVDSRQTRRLRALRLLAVHQRLRSRAPPEDYVERAQPHQHRGADRHTRQLPLEVAVDPRVGVIKSSQVKFLLSTQIQNSPPLVPGAGSLRRRQNLNHPGAR